MDAKFYEILCQGWKNNLPIHFEKFSSVQEIKVLIQEPLGELIFILQKIYVKVASKGSLIIDKLAVTLEAHGKSWNIKCTFSKYIDIVLNVTNF